MRGGVRPVRSGRRRPIRGDCVEPSMRSGDRDPQPPRDRHRSPSRARSSARSIAPRLLGPPVEAPDPANRCVAVGAPTPQSARQQELVCLTSGHGNCPRYLRGALVAADARRPSADHARPLDAGDRVGPAARRRGGDVGRVPARPRRTRHPGRHRSRRAPSPPSPAARRRRRPSPSSTSPDPDQADAGPDAVANARRRRPTPTVAPTAGPDAGPDPGSDADAAADERPLRAPRPVPGHAGLLDLHRPVGRQPREHRQLLRRAVRHGARHEPADRRPDHDPGRRQDPHAATDPLTWRAIDFADFDALTFDCYGTLIDWEAGISGGARRRCCERTASTPDVEELLAALRRPRGRARGRPVSALSRDPGRGGRGVGARLRRRADRRRGRRPSPRRSGSGRPSRTRPPRSPRSAERFRLGVITNCDDDLFALSNRRLGVTFDWIITAEQAGSYKPRPAQLRARVRADRRAAGADPPRRPEPVPRPRPGQGARHDDGLDRPPPRPPGLRRDAAGRGDAGPDVLPDMASLAEAALAGLTPRPRPGADAVRRLRPTWRTASICPLTERRRAL